MKEITFTIPEIPVGPNGRGGLLRMHWTARRRYFQKWAWLTACEARFLITPCSQASVVIHQHRKKLLDPDNLVASCKPCLDALVKCGIIQDDGPEHCALEVRQSVTKGNVYTEIKVQEVMIG